MFVYRFPKMEGKNTIFVRSTAVDFYLTTTGTTRTTIVIENDYSCIGSFSFKGTNIVIFLNL